MIATAKTRYPAHAPRITLLPRTAAEPTATEAAHSVGRTALSVGLVLLVLGAGAVLLALGALRMAGLPAPW